MTLFIIIAALKYTAMLPLMQTVTPIFTIVILTNLTIVTTVVLECLQQGCHFYRRAVMLYLLFGKHLGGLSDVEFELDDKVTLTTDTDLHSIDV